MGSTKIMRFGILILLLGLGMISTLIPQVAGTPLSFLAPVGSRIRHVLALVLGRASPENYLLGYSSPGGSVWMVMAPKFGCACRNIRLISSAWI